MKVKGAYLFSHSTDSMVSLITVSSRTILFISLGAEASKISGNPGSSVSVGLEPRFSCYVYWVTVIHFNNMPSNTLVN